MLQMLIHVVAGVLPSTLVFYLLFCIVAKREHRVVGFFASWILAVVVAVLISPNSTASGALSVSTKAGFISVASVLCILLGWRLSQDDMPGGASNPNRKRTEKEAVGGKTGSDRHSKIGAENVGPDLHVRSTPRRVSAPRPAWEGRVSPYPPRSAQSTGKDDEATWAKILSELNSSNRRPGLWAKVFAESDGDENRAKAAYLRARYEEMAKDVSGGDA